MPSTSPQYGPSVLWAEPVTGPEYLQLATDPDREGEAISWNVREVREQRRVLDGVKVKRVVFNEITKKAVREAFANPRDLDFELIEAYLARRALDYLFGFTLSPVLWRKLPGSRSAGRVQSVALRLICEREMEVESFKPREYWTVRALFRTGSGEKVPAQLTHVAGNKLDKMGLADEAAASAAIEAAEARDFAVAQVERKKVRRHPAPPFTTSTLQQEAARKLRFSTKHTMQVAQKLYEGVNIGGDTVGLITYMRTDGVQIAGEAIAACRSLIAGSHGADYLPPSPRAYRTKAKNAQEAHEAIRPTDFNHPPEDMAAYLDRDQQRLYELIWKRMVASQMESAVLDQVAVRITSDDGAVAFRATGSVVAFDGFQKLYREGRDEANGKGEEERILPDIKEGEALHRENVDGEQHFTQRPPRYSDASRVQRPEALVSGPPPPYASPSTAIGAA